MTIKTLETVPITLLAAVFNEAFSDYVIPFSLSETDLKAKIAAENIRLDCSLGVFLKNKPIGFILVGVDTIDRKPTAYNAGTGVIPKCRGQRQTQAMYDYLLPLLQLKGISHHLLEVITHNEKAIHIYKRIGFETLRTLNCYKGNIAPSRSSFDFKPLDVLDWELMVSFWDFKPSYQNSIATINRMKNDLEFAGAFADGNLVGYIVFGAARIKQFAVHPQFRKKGIGRQLFYEVQKKAGNTIVSLTNIDAANKGTNVFLLEIGLVQIVQQLEMGMKIN